MKNTKTNQAPTASRPFFRSAVEVANYLGIHERTVRRMMHTHRLPYTKLGGALLVRKADLDATIEAATFPSHAMQQGRGRRGRVAALAK